MQAWQVSRQDVIFTGCGCAQLLAPPLVAFFSSRQCPGIAIRAAMDWALQQASSSEPVVSGFHSSLEQSVLKLLLQARCPVVAVLARPVEHARLPPEWHDPLAQGRMAVVSAATRPERLTAELAALRNQWVAQLARKIVVAHASPGGALAGLVQQWQVEGRDIERLS